MVSIVIPTKGRSSIRRLIHSIEACANRHALVAHRDFEIVVAFDSRVASPLSDLGTSVRVVTSPGPGVNRARNAGALAGLGEVLWFLDDDVELGAELGEGSFHVALNEIFAPSRRIAAGGNYRSRDEATFVERGYNAFCSLWRVSAGIEGAEQLLGGTLAVRKRDWERAGGFDESIEYGGAETSFVLRLNQLSDVSAEPIVFDERLDVFHHSGPRSWESWKELAGRQAREKSKTEAGLPSSATRVRRSLAYLSKQELRTLAALAVFSVPYLAVSKMKNRKL